MLSFFLLLLSRVHTVLVIEEYDKLDCSMRGFFRQLLEHGGLANVTLNRCGPCACVGGRVAVLVLVPCGSKPHAPLNS